MLSSLDPAQLSALDRAIDDLAEDAFAFLERLVAAPSTVGAEMPAQRVVRDELDRLGFETSVLPIPADIAADPVAGVPQQPYAGRGNVSGTWPPGPGRRCSSTGISTWSRPRPRCGRRRRSSRSGGTAGWSGGAPAT